MSADQEQLDALFGVSRQDRVDMSEGIIPRVLRRQRESPSGSVTIAAGFGCFFMLGGLLGQGIHGRAGLWMGGALLVFILLLVVQVLRFQGLLSRPIQIRRVEGDAHTRRYWFPTYGEVSRLSAELMLGDERLVLPSSFEDHVVTGPVCVFALPWEHRRRAPAKLADRVVAIELLPGASLRRLAPKHPPPKDFLRIEPAD